MNIAPLGSDFLWGAATAAYQIEGAHNVDGKGPSIWDVFCAIPGKTQGNDTGEIACDHYHRWQEDIELMQRLGLRGYRLSLSWPRVLPQGRGPVNQKGWDFYDRLLDGLCAAGITPMVTLFHWDLPAALQFELGGWAHPDLAPIFADYAEQAFRRLGDRAPLWLTLNEPWVVVDAGYFHGVFPPGVKNQRQGYLVGHNLLRAHAHAVARFRGQGRAGGQISFALNSAFYFPQSDSAADRAAAERAVVNFAGWFADPPHFGDYPALLRERLGNLLPAFSDEDTRLLRRSMDYIALNYYTSDVVRHAPGRGVMEYELATGPDVPRTEMHWPIMPAGQHALLCWLSERYERLPVYITENGAALPDRPDAAGYVHDLDRIAYLRDHFAAAARAARDGVDLRGYFVWSLIDNLEWAAGFAKRFGLIHCDRRTLRRTIKASGEWYARVIATGELDAAPAATPLAAGAGGD